MRNRESVDRGRVRTKADDKGPKVVVPGRGQRDRSRSSPWAGGRPESKASALYKGSTKVEFFWSDWFRSVEEAPEQVGSKLKFKRAQWCGKQFFAQIFDNFVWSQNAKIRNRPVENTRNRMPEPAT